MFHTSTPSTSLSLLIHSRPASSIPVFQFQPHYHSSSFKYQYTHCSLNRALPSDQRQKVCESQLTYIKLMMLE